MTDGSDDVAPIWPKTIADGVPASVPPDEQPSAALLQTHLRSTCRGCAAGYLTIDGQQVRHMPIAGQPNQQPQPSSGVVQAPMVDPEDPSWPGRVGTNGANSMTVSLRKMFWWVYSGECHKPGSDCEQKTPCELRLRMVWTGMTDGTLGQTTPPFTPPALSITTPVSSGLCQPSQARKELTGVGTNFLWMWDYEQDAVIQVNCGALYKVRWEEPDFAFSAVGWTFGSGLPNSESPYPTMIGIDYYCGRCL
jgi:hypothetical protein